MNNLVSIKPINITKSNNVSNGVDARELHSFLEVTTRFDTWLNRRIEEYVFEEGRDFCSILSETPNGGRPRTEYTLSLSMAKELAMVERTEKGKLARKYFIACEEKLKKQERMISEQNNAIVRGVMLEKWMDRLNIDKALLAKYFDFRSKGLSQRELAKLFDVSREKIGMIEKVMREFGIHLPTVQYQQRQKVMIKRLESALFMVQSQPVLLQ